MHRYIYTKFYRCAYTYKYIHVCSSPSLSTIAIISKQSDCIMILLGKEDESIVRLSDSSVSNMLSSSIEILKLVLVLPAGIVTLNGPET